MTDKIKMSEEEVAFSEIIGDLVEQWGFNRHLGRIWSLLFLRQKPLSPSEIQEGLSLSAGSVSSGLSELQTWGVVKRIRMAGDRNFYYEPETRIWKSVSNVLRTREVRILEEAQGGLQALVQRLQSRKQEENTDFQVKRIKHVREAMETAHALFNALIDGGALTIPKLGRLFDKFRSF
jgi:HTH-type transcriptional regulator, glycine betaine synthesis regulator